MTTASIKKLIDLGLRIEELWEKQGPDEQSFSKICLKELSHFNFSYALDIFEKDLSQWLLGPALPKQLNVYNSFGQPPITIFNNGNFVIDIYIWRDVDTSIHSHSFSGAFKVLYGRSLHEQFSIETQHTYANDVLGTNIELNSFDLVGPSQTIEILRGNQFIHRLIHLDNPTITLCARTINDEEKAQWHHFRNGLAIQKKALEEKVIKGLYYFQYLFSKNNTSALEFLNHLIESWDISTTLNLYEQLTIDSMGIEPEAIEHFFKAVLKRYQDQEWFKTYEDFYHMMEQNIELQGDGADIRFLEHAINNHYSLKEAQTTLAKIQNRPLNSSELEFLSTTLR